ncbi:hypothetical protein QE152_g39300 [Popillia japonica]|uniref:Uncharacterized protein n=1 Tax=Popillia japonica TaxID=7064 RepID=A0AAW1HUX0_POPJA
MARQELTRNHIDIIPKYEGDPNTLSMYIGTCEYLAVTFGNPQNPADAINGFLLRIFQSKLEGRALQRATGGVLSYGGNQTDEINASYQEEQQEEYYPTEEIQWIEENYTIKQTKLMHLIKKSNRRSIILRRKSNGLKKHSQNSRKTTTNMRITPASWSNQR